MIRRQAGHGGPSGWFRMKFLLMILIAAALAPQARAQAGLDDGTRGRLDNAPLGITVACGAVTDPLCARVVPRIGAKSAAAGVVLSPMDLGPMGPMPADTAYDPVEAVCKGWSAAAIVPADLAVPARDCKGGFSAVGQPLFPLYAFLITRAGGDIRSAADLAGDGAPILVDQSARRLWDEIGGRGIRSRRETQETSDSEEAALKEIADGYADAYFTLAPLDGSLTHRTRTALDVNRRPLYALLDVRVGPRANCLYRVTGVDLGGPAPFTTVSEDAVMVLGRGYREAHAKGGPAVPDALAFAIAGAQDAIRADMHVAPGWRPGPASCH